MIFQPKIVPARDPVHVVGDKGWVVEYDMGPGWMFYLNEFAEPTLVPVPMNTRDATDVVTKWVMDR